MRLRRDKGMVDITNTVCVRFLANGWGVISGVARGDDNWFGQLLGSLGSYLQNGWAAGSFWPYMKSTINSLDVFLHNLQTSTILM